MTNKPRLLCLIWQSYDSIEVYNLEEDDNDEFIKVLCNTIIDVLKDYICDTIVLKQIDDIHLELNKRHKKSPLQCLQLLEYLITELDYLMDEFKKFEIVYLQTKFHNNLEFKKYDR